MDTGFNFAIGITTRFSRFSVGSELKCPPDNFELMELQKENIKRLNGQYFTRANPFLHPEFRQWARSAHLPSAEVLEPFAGANGLIGFLKDMALCQKFRSYDIEPVNTEVIERDTLAAFPEGYDVCITNPPWLAKNSATVRGLPFPRCQYDDLYKFALEKCLENCKWVATLVPESFIRANLFQDRLQSFVSLTGDLFADTGHPVGLALFGPEPTKAVSVWSGHTSIGLLSSVQNLRPDPLPDGPEVKFNDPDGNVGLIALDNTREASIRFCDISELENYSVKISSRHITKVSVNCPLKIKNWNAFIDQIREQTHDVLMTSYKGIRKDGKYRRRCDWMLARGIVHHVK